MLVSMQQRLMIKTEVKEHKRTKKIFQNKPLPTPLRFMALIYLDKYISFFIANWFTAA